MDLKTASNPEGPPSSRAPLLRILLALCAVTAVGLTVLGLVFLNTPVDPKGATVEISRGSSLRLIAGQLEDAGVVSSALGFRLLGRWKGLSEQIHAGEYLFEQPSPPLAVLRRLVEGDVRRWPLTIPEGLRLTEIAALFERQELASAEELLRLSTDLAFLNRFDIPAASLEGYLFPETYSFVRGTAPEKLLAALIEEMNRNLTPELLEQAKKKGMNRHKLLTLASIIQKEAGSEEEMPLISSVFHNRLKKRMRLQTDPTVIYGLQEFDGNLTWTDLKTPSPYNTYLNYGLPPGPIASPGKAALRAAAEPAETDFLYFVSRGDGSHAFSRTLKEHNTNVRRYQLGR